jgi:hypothetical protein
MVRLRVMIIDEGKSIRKITLMETVRVRVRFRE